MKNVYSSLDNRAKEHAQTFLKSGAITENAIHVISSLYEDVGAEKKYNEDGKFESAYQLSVTPLFEFYFGRLLYWLSEEAHYGWKVYLRRQVQRCAPDIRIEKDGRTIAIIEIKIKGGWMQPFFSKERFAADEARRAQKKSDFNPQEDINKLNKQLDKYTIFGSGTDEPLVFLFLPTFNMVHRKKYTATYDDYKQNFFNNTGRAAKHLVVLSQNLTLDLAKSLNGKDKPLKQLTEELEDMLQWIVAVTPGIPAKAFSGAKMLEVPASA